MSDTDDRTRITQILVDAREAGGGDATARLAEALYLELRRLAAALMRRERRDHTLQPTALVGEALLRLVDQSRIDWKDRTHFLGIAARVMRQILVDHARRHGAAKRGAGVQLITLSDNLSGSAGPVELLLVNDALDRFALLDVRGARVVEMRVFGGLTMDEIADALGVSKRTVDNDWAVARMWLARELSGSGSPLP
ncbi:MAG TPA: sigma-70 family RNA polymerase sigma factor [Vicinamibacterales bacterium]|nr:sigma-70 family RNA polymerase sigma factor [Vicinamibacterales bacterium]